MIDTSSKDMQGTKSLSQKIPTRISLSIPSKSSGKVISKTTRVLPSRTSRGDLSKTSRRDLSKTSKQDLSKTLKQDLLRTPGRDLLRIAGRNVTRIPGRDLSKPSRRDLSKTSRRDLSKTSRRDLSKTSRRDLSKTSRRDLSKTSRRDLSKTSRRDVSKTSRRDLSKTSRRDLSKTSKQDLSKTLKQDLLRTPGRDLLRIAGRNVTRIPGRDLSKTSRRDLSKTLVRHALRISRLVPLKTSRRNLLKTSRRDLIKTSRRDLLWIPGYLWRTTGRNVSKALGRDPSRMPGLVLSSTLARHLSWTPKDVLRTPGRNVSRTPGRDLLKTSGRDLLRSSSPARTKASYSLPPTASSIQASIVYTKPSRSIVLTEKQTNRTQSDIGMSKSKDITTKQLISGVITSQTNGLIKGISKSDVKTQLMSVVMLDENYLSGGNMSNKHLLRADVWSKLGTVWTHFTTKVGPNSSSYDPASYVYRAMNPFNWTWYWRYNRTTTTRSCMDRLGYRIRCTNATRRYRPRKKKKPTTTLRATLTRWVEIVSTPSITFYDDDTTTLTTTLTTTPNDIKKLLNILDNLTYFYDTDLVKKFNESLLKEGYPYCPTSVTTPTEGPSTTTVATNPPPGVLITGSMVVKCFVCGMRVPGIPEQAKCADAFAGDFFPTAPVDLTSRKFIDSYRKHCRYVKIRNWYMNGSLDKEMWGEWTGGCSVRWVDLSGVYTQRSCRNRYRPAMGKHYASARMAMLEKALLKEKDACIISPQASLVPFSRGVSLYARFHACVCSGDYCNQAERLTPLSVLHMVLFTMANRLMKHLIKIKEDIIPVKNNVRLD